MTCLDCTARLDAYLDQELDVVQRDDLERHLETCLECQLRHERYRALSSALRDQLPTYTAPDLLRARIDGAMRAVRTERTGTQVRRWRWIAIAASVLFVLAAGYAALGIQRPASPQVAMAHEVLASHVRSLMPDHLTDVASTDQHNVKPWFNGRLDYSPPVYDLAAQGFPLVGGRLDYVGGRPVAALVYQRRKHVINLFVWPTAQANGGTPEVTQQGYHLLHWTRGGMTYWAASDLNGEELREFARLEQQMDSVAASR